MPSLGSLPPVNLDGSSLAARPLPRVAAVVSQPAAQQRPTTGKPPPETFHVKNTIFFFSSLLGALDAPGIYHPLLFGFSHSLSFSLFHATPMTTQSLRAAINLRRVFCCHR